MRYRIWDPGTLEIYDRAGLTHQQRTFLEGVLRSLEAGTYLSEHVATAHSEVISDSQAYLPEQGHPGRHADEPGWLNMGVEPQ